MSPLSGETPTFTRNHKVQSEERKERKPKEPPPFQRRLEEDINLRRFKKEAAAAIKETMINENFGKLPFKPNIRAS